MCIFFEFIGEGARDPLGSFDNKGGTAGENQGEEAPEMLVDEAVAIEYAQKYMLSNNAATPGAMGMAIDNNYVIPPPQPALGTSLLGEGN